MDMMTGVMGVQFRDQQRKEIQSKYAMVTPSQMRWMQVQELVISASPNFDVMNRPKGQFRVFFFRLIHNKYFEYGIMTFIILNIVSLCMSFEGMSDFYENMLTIFNYIFTAVFTIEMLCKLIALDWQYFKSYWNVFDFAIVMVSYLDIIFTVAGNSSTFLQSAPVYAKMLRVLRVTRLFKLMKAKQLEGINKIFKTIWFSMPTLLNVFMLMFLNYFIFAILGCFVFDGVKLTVSDTQQTLYYQNEIFNFSNFHSALMLLFRNSTGEDWPAYMFLYSGTTGSLLDQIKGQGFYIIFYFISSFVMLEVFQLVVMQQFDEFYFNPDNSKNSFDELSETFRNTWNHFTIKHRGAKIKTTKIVDLFYYLE